MSRKAGHQASIVAGMKIVEEPRSHSTGLFHRGLKPEAPVSAAEGHQKLLRVTVP